MAMFRPHFDNVRGQGDRISSAANASALDVAESDDPYVDARYGHTWSFTPKRGAALYGRTEDFPASPIDHLANGRFLRVPFRRVPVIDVGSADELAAFAGRITSADKTIQLMWRGQVKEYYLARTNDELERLFGSTSALEPSLVPSASRANVEFADVLPAWSAILDLYISECREILRTAHGSIADEIAQFHASYNYRLWAFATAQHYGLPSVGLDITTDLWTAVLFALHEFRYDATSARTIASRAPAGAQPVVYAMGGFQNDLFEDAALAPSYLQCQRPKAQTAHFFGTGWGAASNKAAERIFIAFRLLNHHGWTLRKRIEDLFPPTSADPFVAFLLRVRERHPDIARHARLDRVYYLS